jgi:hypothetical protein
MSSNRLRLLLVSLLAVFAVSAVVSASASAVACTTESGAPNLPVYCVGSLTDQDGTLTNEKVKATGNTFKLKAEGLNIECTALSGTAEISSSETTAGTDSNVKLTFTNCKIENVSTSKCTVNNENASNEGGETPGTIEVPATTSALKDVSGTIYDVFGAMGVTFVNIEIDKVGSEVCAAAVGAPTDGYVVKGQSCGVASLTLKVKAPLTFSEANEIACGAAERLKVGAKTASLEGTSEQELEGTLSGKEWAVMLT